MTVEIVRAGFRSTVVCTNSRRRLAITSFPVSVFACTPHLLIAIALLFAASCSSRLPAGRPLPSVARDPEASQASAPSTIIAILHSGTQLAGQEPRLVMIL